MVQTLKPAVSSFSLPGSVACAVATSYDSFFAVTESDVRLCKMSAPIHEMPLPNAISMLAIKPNQATATHDLVVGVDPRVGLYTFILTSTHVLFGIQNGND